MAPSFVLSLSFLFFLPQVRPEIFLVSRLGSLSLSFSLSVAHTRGCSSSRLVPPPAIKVARGGPRGLGASGRRATEVDVQRKRTGFAYQVGSRFPGKGAAAAKGFVGGKVAANLLGGRKLQMEASWKRILISVMGHQWALWGAKGAAEKKKTNVNESNYLFIVAIIQYNLILV